MKTSMSSQGKEADVTTTNDIAVTLRMPISTACYMQIAVAEALVHLPKGNAPDVVRCRQELEAARAYLTDVIRQAVEGGGHVH